MTKTRDWISVVISKETRRRLLYLIKEWGENRSQTVRRCIDFAFENVEGTKKAQKLLNDMGAPIELGNALTHKIKQEKNK